MGNVGGVQQQLYSWMQNGIVTSYGTASIPSSATSSGEVWTVQAIPNDGYTDGNYTEESLIISEFPFLDL